MKKIIKILLKIIGVAFLIVLMLWLISYGIGINIYIKNALNVPKLATLEQEKQYVEEKRKEVFKDIDVFKILFAGGGWRARTVLALNQKLFEYFPKESNEDVDAISHLADCYVWVGGKENAIKAISLYQKSIDVFNKIHLAEKAPIDENPVLFEIRKYEYLIGRHREIAKIYKRLNRYDKVIEEYQKVISTYYDSIKKFNMPTQYMLIGRIYEDMGHIYLRIYKRYDKAIEIFKKVQDLFSTPLAESTNKINIGDCYLAMGKENKAIEIYKGVVHDYSIKNSAARDAENRLKNLKRWKIIITKYEPLLF